MASGSTSVRRSRRMNPGGGLWGLEPVPGGDDVRLDGVVGCVGRIARGHAALEERSGGSAAVVSADSQDDRALLLHGVIALIGGTGSVVEGLERVGLCVASLE